VLSASKLGRIQGSSSAAWRQLDGTYCQKVGFCYRLALTPLHFMGFETGFAFIGSFQVIPRWHSSFLGLLLPTGSGLLRSSSTCCYAPGAWDSFSARPCSPTPPLDTRQLLALNPAVLLGGPLLALGLFFRTAAYVT